MNFTTNLPKSYPYVTYVVASAMRTHPMEDNENTEFRMHAVIPYYGGKNFCQKNQYILCHVRSVSQKHPTQQLDLSSCFVDGYTDFYRLLVFLHN